MGDRVMPDIGGQVPDGEVSILGEELAEDGGVHHLVHDAGVLLHEGHVLGVGGHRERQGGSGMSVSEVKSPSVRETVEDTQSTYPSNGWRWTWHGIRSTEHFDCGFREL